MAELPAPPEGIALAHFIVSADIDRSRRFYTEVLGGRVAFSGPGGLTYIALSNSWIIINTGGGPTDDKPAVTLETPRDPDRRPPDRSRANHRPRRGLDTRPLALQHTRRDIRVKAETTSQ
jgi:catechol 2,3-dioxygenase-like lactoylglutathione lyase family enzyme